MRVRRSDWRHLPPAASRPMDKRSEEGIMCELLLTCSLLLSVAGLTMGLRAVASSFDERTLPRAATHPPASNEVYAPNLVDTYLACRR